MEVNNSLRTSQSIESQSTESEYAESNQSQPRHRYLSCDERIWVHTLRDIGWQLDDIVKMLNISWAQAQYAASHRVTPKKCPGHPPVLSKKQIDEIELFIVSSKTGKLMSYLELSKPPLSEANKWERLHWVQEHINWTREQCDNKKGPGIFWEKDWGTIVRFDDGLTDCIQTVWCMMKDYIEQKWGSDHRFSYDELRVAVQEAWNAISEEDLDALTDSMSARCDAVIAAQSGHTKY
ncbi:uncharacterized protein EI97DRAFT_496760 [Westerdykella ornata]|uniref:Tc1-like transposase DDE domain-containing protein n=1 Tax=Westerdykella ornata TaxID=318751 RepID=A0A6A6J7T9_WESOR|nr:uncharacterized protein EI97DRAFT_496760 [Westerdykella ornata]KAF2272233.1 hypothetical protein EI97DRAFT_496760 [Westerdykella ornata]